MGAQMRSDPEDPQKKGVQVDGKMVLRVASNALKTVLTNLAPKVLPFSELVRHITPIWRRRREEGMSRRDVIAFATCVRHRLNEALGPLYKFMEGLLR